MTSVLRCITRLNVGGPARQAILLTERLPELGFPSELVAGVEGDREGALRPRTRPATLVRSLRRSTSLLADARARAELARILHERRPDIVHTHLAKAGALGRTAARRAGVRLVVHTYHGHVLRGYFAPPFSELFRRIERRLADRTDALVAVSSRIRDELLELGIGRPGQWRVIPAGLELGAFLEDDRDSRRAAEALGLPGAGPRVGIVGRLVEIKDVDAFLDAAARIAAEVPHAGFVVAGDGELRDRLERRARTLLGGRIRFVGWVTDLPSLYRALDVVVLTSRAEGTPTALIEAGAAGRPVVATRVGGVPDVVRDGSTGSLVPPRDPAAVAGAVVRLLGDPHRARSYGDAARARVRERFSADRLVRDTVALYEELLSGAHGPAAG